METEYIAAGANRHPSCADWFRDILAYGSGRNVALWRPHGQDDAGSRGVSRLLTGHTDTVNAVKFLQTPLGLLLISGSVDKTVRVWYSASGSGDGFTLLQVLTGPEGSINCIAVSKGAGIFATGSADGTVTVWEIGSSRDEEIRELQSIKVKPRFFPLALGLSPLSRAPGSFVLAVAGTAAIIQLYVADGNVPSVTDRTFKLQATLSGHEGWIRSLAFTQETGPDSDLLLASASQDKYIRLWRIHQGKELPKIAATGDPSLGAFMPGKSLSNKAHRFVAGAKDYSATFEALLLGHEDWIYSALWRPQGSSLQLLSASADNSLAIWEQDVTSGVWVTIARLGEISAEKGSTTATGSTGGFWTGLWSPSGEAVTSLGRTGSWRLWNFSSSQDRWIPGVGVSGHIQSVTGIAWSRDGSYILSTSSDQTTRLHAQWKRHGGLEWHEMARPQIHGYDLNCIDSLGKSRFVSGADEKLLRVFAEPKAVAHLLSALCGIENEGTEDMPSAANMPVLGLSNKAIDALSDEAMNTNGGAEAAGAKPMIEQPPLEDALSRQTLWPEIEKLYGHGYEISTLAASHDGSVIATACKASSIDHAVIRIFETEKWTEVKPPLSAHALTVTRLRFSDDDRLLLSVGRDRQWAVFERKQGVFSKIQADLKGHSRMILDATWVGAEAFATAGRDKSIKIWAKGDEGFELKNTIKEDEPVTAVDFMGGYLAAGTESGKLLLYQLDLASLAISERHVVDRNCCPSKAITQLSWRPGDNVVELAVASEDCSLRIFALKALLSTCDGEITG